MLEANQKSDFGKLACRDTAAIGGTDDGADTGSGDEVDGNALFFEDLESAYVGDATGEASAEGETDLGTLELAG